MAETSVQYAMARPPLLVRGGVSLAAGAEAGGAGGSMRKPSTGSARSRRMGVNFAPKRSNGCSASMVCDERRDEALVDVLSLSKMCW